MFDRLLTFLGTIWANGRLGKPVLQCTMVLVLVHMLVANVLRIAVVRER